MEMSMTQRYKNIDSVSMRWNVNPSVLQDWCIEKKIIASYVNDTWMIDTEQVCPLLKFNEHFVYSLEKTVIEFNISEATVIYYNEYYVFTDITIQDDIFHHHGNYKTIVSKENTAFITESELAQLCYLQYLLDYQTSSGCYPIFLKEFKTLKTLMF